MDKLKGSARHVLGLQRTDELPSTNDYRPAERDDHPKDSERLLASSPAPSGESESTTCEKSRHGCDCVCHQRLPPRRLTPVRINLFASLLWLLGALLILLVFRRDSGGDTPANGTFGWCE